MTEEAKRDLIRQLKKEVHSNPDLTAMDDGQMRALIQRTLDAKLACAGTTARRPIGSCPP